GTTMEDIFHADISPPLWSSKPLDQDPEVIIQAHLAFLRAGVRVIETASYQAAFSTFAAAGYSASDAERLMRRSVQLAATARTRFAAETQAQAAPGASACIALSLGAFGATLPLPHELDGHYPPPFGPQAFRADGPNLTAFAPDARAAADASVAALADFHLARLRVFAGDADAWGAVDALAFETVPLVREVTALRRAMTALRAELGARAWKPWWISTVWPAGALPEEVAPGGPRMGPREVVAALFGQAAGEAYERPDAFAVNCSALDYIPAIVGEAEQAVRDLGLDGEKPWLLLKPNGGQEFDVRTRTWSQSRGKDAWATELTAVVKKARAGGVWGGVLAGGCCKTVPDDMRALSAGIQT
ncbi:Homocysteine S-methyltransferase, partial [Auriscalpium vulgare]